MSKCKWQATVFVPTISYLHLQFMQKTLMHIIRQTVGLVGGCYDNHGVLFLLWRQLRDVSVETADDPWICWINQTVFKGDGRIYSTGKRLVLQSVINDNKLTDRKNLYIFYLMCQIIKEKNTSCLITDCRLYTLHNSFHQTETLAHATVTDGVRDTVDHKNACLCLVLYSLITDCKLYTLHNYFHQTETLAHATVIDGVGGMVEHKNACLCLGL